MYVSFGSGEIRYTSSKDTIAKTVQEGTIFFRGQFKKAAVPRLRGTTSGTAYLFKKSGEPAPYSVSGPYDGNTSILKGSAQ